MDVIRQHPSATLRKHVLGPFSAGRKTPFEKKGLHFAEAPDELRRDYILLLRYLPFRGYVAFRQLPSPEAYAELYLRLLGSLLVQPFKSYDRGTVHIRIEQNGRVPEKQLRASIAEAYSDLEPHNERRRITVPNVYRIGAAACGSL